MASFKYEVRSKSNPCELYLRFTNGRSVSCKTSSKILVNSAYWSNKMNSYKTQAPQAQRDIIKRKIQELNTFIVDKYNESFSNGDIINSSWLKLKVDEYHKRPLGEQDHTKYIIPFIESFAKESESRVNIKTGKVISFKTIQKYNTIIKHLNDFQEKENKIYKISDINLDFHRLYTSYLRTDLNLSGTTIEKDISTIKGFVKEAKAKGVEISDDIFSKKFTFTRDETIDVYLNEKEILSIFKLDLSNNISLDNVRDVFIIGLWTGLRISDLKRIDQFHVTDSKILISGSVKSIDSIEIPIHYQVQAILNKRKRALPKMISDQKFNKYIKDVCQLAGIEEVVLGKMINPKTKRKEVGYFPKYKLVSSHTCRRSFATNHYGKLPNRTIMAITGHKSEQQFMKYIKTTNKEHMEKVEELWGKTSKQ